ncbi:hypothetical protein BW723_15960 [Polaribacter reichenbachii]|uniref:Uncharacterized protein n=1 Tax=Polaribacter reichenbachii TaxID=996801 RepID=A0A1B8U2X7_9FLAO|nr:hypothetical protein [Polaribacter reichenbachii]APZ47695.1 hypothetical protein BW723_15960 [Polaribacter reichenbachii]AUC18334.1 hypothetical protein BTO17_06400 [Polaribacter reichenbachii]OBY66236.1 hypothetical protein LPB301_06975 [Polaribacter reichenbachii]
MEITTINQIREKRDSIREQIKSLNLKSFGSTTYGNENEYTFKGLIAGIDALLTDISTLTQYQNKFVKISTYNERNGIYSNLNRIDTYLQTPNNYISQFEALKVQIRAYNVRNISERQLEFEKEIEEVRKIKIELQQILVESKELNESIDEKNDSIEKKLETSTEKLTEIESELEKITERKDELIEQSETLETINDKLNSIKESASDNLEEITTSLTESKGNEKLITSFANKVQDREKKLDELEQNTNSNNEKLSEYIKERETILKQANELIESSKKALNYTTAEGISASFQEQYNNSNNWKIFGSWIFGAVICLLGTIALGIWILKTKDDNIGILIGRISLLPLPIIGAIFCANQYTKQKNIIEDYAYKMVLSKAIVGFSEQLKKNGTDGNEEYVHYIKTALIEIHKDPLRKREKTKQTETKDTNFKDLIEVAERIVKLTKVE